MSEKRYGFVGIVVDSAAASGTSIQPVLSRHADIILGRMGLPHLEDGNIAVITLIVHATTDELGALTGQLGKMPGIAVKSALAKQRNDASPEDSDGTQ